jgi:hypothetical protein
MKQSFIDDLNTAVITTKFVLEDNSLIQFVYHYEEDGFWEFLGAENSTEEEYRIISLEEVIIIDESILEIADLPLGSFAYRNDKNDKWKVEKIQS